MKLSPLRAPIRLGAAGVVTLLVVAACSTTGDPDGTADDATEESTSDGTGVVPDETPTGGTAGEGATDATEGAGSQPGDGDPQPGPIREIGTAVATWREEPGDGHRVRPGEFEAVLTSQEEWDAWTDSLVVDLGMPDDLAADIDFSTSVAVAVSQFECGTGLVLITDGAGALAGQQVPDEPGVHIDCAWSPFVLTLFEVELDELGTISVDELRLDDTLTVPTEEYRGASG